MMVKKVRFATILSILLFFIFLIASLPLVMTTSASEILPEESTVLAENDDVFTIDAYDREDRLIINNDYFNYNDGNAQVYQWKDVKKLKFNIDFSTRIPPSRPDDQNVPVYDIKINLDYLRGYKKASWLSSSRYSFENLTSYSQTLRGEESYLNLQSFPDFNIDQGITSTTTTNITASAKEWGIYQYILLVNGRPFATSNYIIIEPTIDVYSRPETKMTVTGSETSLRDAYNFTLVNEEEYKYIDSTKLVWYAKGQTPDGTIYSLSKSDLTLPDFLDCTDGLYEEGAKPRTGLNFTFEDSGKYGKWEIWCEYKAEGSTRSLVSNRTQIETKIAKSYSYIIWIIVAVAIVSIGVSIAISIYKTKHEKVY